MLSDLGSSVMFIVEKMSVPKDKSFYMLTYGSVNMTAERPYLFFISIQARGHRTSSVVNYIYITQL